jgi:hypothetical protein
VDQRTYRRELHDQSQHGTIGRRNHRVPDHQLSHADWQIVLRRNAGLPTADGAERAGVSVRTVERVMSATGRPGV